MKIKNLIAIILMFAFIFQICMLMADWNNLSANGAMGRSWLAIITGAAMIIVGLNCDEK